MALFRVTLDGNVLADEPEGLMDFVSELKRDKAIRGQVLLVDLTLKFKGGTDGYNILKPLIDCEGFCASSEILIEESCNNDTTFVTIFEGLIFYTEVKEHLFPCILECQLTDDSFFAKIDNNKNIEAFVNVGRSKNDEDISSFVPSGGAVSFFDVVTGTYTSAVNVFSVWECFRFMIKYMTDGDMGFVSDYFGLSGEARGLTITTGEQIRLTSGGGSTKFPFISFQKLFDEVNKKVRIAFTIETIAGVRTVRIEPESYFFNTGTSATLNNVKGIVKSVNTSELYSRLKIGSSETIAYSLGQTDFPTDINFVGFKEESYTMTGTCNIDNTLDLVSDWIIDSNVIQDVFSNGNTRYDDDIFFVMVDFDAGQAVQTDVFNTGGAPLFYNDFLRNTNVASRWLGGVPNSIALYLGSGNDQFRASVNSQITNTLNSPPAVYTTVAFQDDFTSPNFDTNSNYSTITFQYTVPSTGLYSFVSDVNWLEGIGGNQAIIDNILGIRLVMRVLGSNAQDIESNFVATATSCHGIVSATLYLQATDTVEIMFKLNSTLIATTILFTAEIGSYFECVNTTNGGGVFQTYNPEDFKAYQYEIKDFPLTFADYQTIIANPLKLLAFNDGTNDYDGWIENMKYHHIKGTADFVLSKSIHKTACE